MKETASTEGRDCAKVKIRNHNLRRLFAEALQTLEVRPSTISGQGCFTLVPLQKRKKIAAYAGELLRGRRRITARRRAQVATGTVKIISFSNDTLAIDAEVGGDATAFINHSCAPNAYMREVPGKQVLFFALRDIKAGEEITINYRDPEHPRHRCAGAVRRSAGRGGVNADGEHRRPQSPRRKCMR